MAVIIVGKIQAAEELAGKVADAIAKVEGKSRTRTVGAAAVVAAVSRRLMGERSDLIEIDGGGVANSYGYRAEATSVLGAVCKVADGWVVMLAVARVACSGRHVSLPIGRRTHREYKADNHAYWVAYGSLCAIGLNDVADDLLAALSTEWLDRIVAEEGTLGVWAVALDFVQEHGTVKQAETASFAAVLIRRQLAVLAIA